MVASAQSLRSGSSRKARRLYGSEVPRIFTPPLRDLNEETSLGFAAIEFAEDVCGISLFPWQRWLLIHGLELDPSITVSTMGERDPLDPLFRFRKVVVLVARQNGKSTLSQVLSLFFLFQLGTSLVLGTAQDLDTAEEVWDGAQDIIDETPELAELTDKPIRVNGKKTIRLKTGERYKVKAANRKAGRGLSGDLILLDELREHTSWDAWGAITKTTTARPSAQIWSLSNAGDASSIVLRHLRASAHAALGDPDGVNATLNPSTLLPSEGEMDADVADGVSAEMVAEDLEGDEAASALGLFEWSAPPGCDIHDRAGWAWANPSLGYGISERTLAGDAKSDPEWTYRTEALCQWSDGSLQGLFPPGKWEGQEDPVSAVAPGGRKVLALAMSHDRSRAHIAIAGLRADGIPHVGVIASRAGVDWVIPWLQADDAPDFDFLVVQERGAPESALLDELEHYGIPLARWGGGDLTAGHGLFYDAVAADDGGRMRHQPQPVLDVAVAVAATKLLSGGAWVVDLVKSPADASPLKAAIGAYWGLMSQSLSRPSAYEAGGLIII